MRRAALAKAQMQREYLENLPLDKLPALRPSHYLSNMNAAPIAPQKSETLQHLGDAEAEVNVGVPLPADSKVVKGPRTTKNNNRRRQKKAQGRKTAQTKAAQSQAQQNDDQPDPELLQSNADEPLPSIVIPPQTSQQSWAASEVFDHEGRAPENEVIYEKIEDDSDGDFKPGRGLTKKPKKSRRQKKKEARKRTQAKKVKTEESEVQPNDGMIVPADTVTLPNNDAIPPNNDAASADNTSVRPRIILKIHPSSMPVSSSHNSTQPTTQPSAADAPTRRSARLRARAKTVEL